MKGSSALPALTVLFLVNILNFYDRTVMGALAEPLRREFALNDTQLGALATLFTLVYAVAGLPLGRLADRGSRRRLLALGVTVWAGLTGLGAMATNYTMLAATRLGVGIGEAVCAPAGTSWIGDVVPAGMRARALAVFMMAVPIGSMLSFSIGGPVAQAYGWRLSLWLAAAPALALVPALLWLKEPPRLSGAAHHASARGVFLRQAAFWWIVASGALLNFIAYAFATFVPAFFTRVHGLSVAQSGFWAGIGSGVAGILGGLAAGVIGDRLPRRRMLLAAGFAAVAVAPFWIALGVPDRSVPPAITLVMVSYGLLQTYYGLVYASIQDLVPSEMRGTAMAVYFVAMYLCGASFGPLVTGRLSDHFARAAAAAGLDGEAARAAGLHQAMYVIPLCAAALAVVLWAGSRAMRSRTA